jgi:hypothetical protein
MNTLYAWLLIFPIIAPITQNNNIKKVSATLLIFFLLKWITDYHKCTASYIECKLRGVKKEQGYIFQFIEPIINLNQSKYRIYLYVVASCLLVMSYQGQQYGM